MSHDDALLLCAEPARINLGLWLPDRSVPGRTVDNAAGKNQGTRQELPFGGKEAPVFRGVSVLTCGQGQGLALRGVLGLPFWNFPLFPPLSDCLSLRPLKTSLWPWD